jgi:hypothetical protein
LAESFIDDNVVSLVQHLKARYRLGLPVMAPTEDERPLRTEEVANRDIDLGFYGHPIVLTLIASKDPFSATALAASSRLVAGAGQRKLVAALTLLAGELTQHADVRTGIGVAKEHEFSTEIADRLGRIAVKKVDGERASASEALVKLLRQLGEGRDIPPNFLCKVLQLGYAADLRRDTLKTMLTGIFASPELRPHILANMTETLPFFPRELLIAVASEINHMTGDPDQSFMKREMQMALASKDRGKRPAAPQREAAPPRKPEIRPWMPMIKKASQIKSRRAAA